MFVAAVIVVVVVVVVVVLMNSLKCSLVPPLTLREEGAQNSLV